MSDTPKEQAPDEWMGIRQEERVWVAKTINGVEICRAGTCEEARDAALSSTPNDLTFSVIEI